MKNKLLGILKYCLLAFLILSVTSCATLFGGQYQEVNVKTGKEDAVVYVDGVKQGKGAVVKTQMERDVTVKQVKIEREGYKDYYLIHKQNHKHPLYYVSWIPGVIFAGIPPLTDSGPTSFNYDKNLRISQDFYIKKRFKKEDEVYLNLAKASIKIFDNKYQLYEFTEKQYLNGARSFINESAFRGESIRFDSAVFYEVVEGLLRDHNFKPKITSETKLKELNIIAELIEVDINSIEKEQKYIYKYYTGDIIIKWAILDKSNKEIYTNRFNLRSDEFSDDSWSNAKKKTIEDAIVKSFYHFLDLEEVGEILKK
ncbi:hypothetical protein [Aureivirga sp. CE67]|uniref:hypothetical protein n=1 Tax=Aureivirga sp. CE67 TaxID=1788983 RepID=UPI0018CA31B2|nr:hypothetical protein [Aureivirga sp. CE67]